MGMGPAANPILKTSSTVGLGVFGSRLAYIVINMATMKTNKEQANIDSALWGANECITSPTAAMKPSWSLVTGS